MALDYQEYDKEVSLVQRICMMLRKMIRDNVFTVGSQLPNEIELAKMLKVSRGSIRAALLILEQSGLIVRRRGIGTFVSKDPMLINNLSRNFGITHVIESMGAIPGTDYIKVYTTPLTDEKIAMRLEIPEDSTLMIIERVRTANGNKVAFTQDIFEINKFYSITHSNSIEEVENYLKEKQSIYSYLSAQLERPIHHAISHILPIQCSDCKITELLGISENSVLLKMEQVDFMTNGEPIWMAREYHISDMFTFSVYRMM